MTSPQVYESLDAVRLPPESPVVLMIGTFDGVHRAHQALMRDAVQRARAIGGIAVVLTFQNHPREIVSPKEVPPLLTPWEEKRELILAQGIDVLVGLRFDKAFAAQSAEDFVHHIVAERLRARVVICGPAFHFGHKAHGNAQLLRALAEKYGYEFLCHEPITHNGVKVSSTRIREALAHGDVALAAELLTRPHHNDGVVVEGDRLGRTIGFPTANLEMSERSLIPANGVYAVRAVLGDGRDFPGMMNIGWRPTVGGIDHRKEVHLINFSGELVGERMRVNYIARLRDEKKFDGIEKLKEQLAKDRANAIAVLETSQIHNEENEVTEG